MTLHGERTKAKRAKKMGRRMKIWLALLFALLAWSMTLGQSAAADPPSEVSLALTKDAAVGERAELVALVIGADGKPMEGVRVTFWAEMAFLSTFDTVAVGEAVTDESGVARAFYIPTTEGEITITARTGNPEEGDLKEASGTLSVRPGGHQFHPEELVHEIRGRWDWLVQWAWLFVFPAGDFATYLFTMILLGIIGRESTPEPAPGAMTPEGRLVAPSAARTGTPGAGRLLVPVGGAVAIVAVASVLIVGITLRPWASTDSGWRTELNLLHTAPEDYHRTAPITVEDESFLESWRTRGSLQIASDSPSPPPSYVGYGCASCHGLQGQGGPVGDDLSDASPSDVRKALKKGPKGMPRFDFLSADDVNALISFLTGKGPVASSGPESEARVSE